MSEIRGIDKDRLYPKADFLLAAGLSDRTWQRLLKRPGFAEIVRRVGQAVFVLGGDFIDWSASCDGSE